MDAKIVHAGGDKVKLPCLIADAAAFLKNVNLQDLCDRVYTIREVVSEIRDSATKQRLSVLPYDIHFREPSTESIFFATEFSKRTGDFKSLSAVDIRVIALTYQLEKEYCDATHIKSEPSKKLEIVQKTKIQSDKEIAGFYFEKKTDVPSNLNPSSFEMTESNDDMDCDEKQENSEVNDEENNAAQIIGNDENHIDDDDDDDENDTTGWITPGNIDKVKEKMGVIDELSVDEKVKCACLTTDFALQNVLIQMGLHVVSVQGMLIRQARNYIQKCFGCYKETTDMEKIFCPSCGNKTLQKVSITITDDGTKKYHYPKRLRNPNIRGTKYSIPAPKGGRQVATILLAEDQRTSQNRLPKKSDKVNPLDPDYVSRSNPFTVNDVNSRAFTLGIHLKHRQARNPNENKKKKSGRKK